MPTQRVNWCGGVLKVRGPAPAVERFVAAQQVRGHSLSLAVLCPEPVFESDAVAGLWRADHWGTRFDLHSVALRRTAQDKAVYIFSSHTTCLCKRLFEDIGPRWSDLSLSYIGFGNGAENVFINCLYGVVTQIEDADNDNGNSDDDDDEDIADSEDQGSDDPLEY